MQYISVPSVRLKMLFRQITYFEEGLAPNNKLYADIFAKVLFRYFGVPQPMKVLYLVKLHPETSSGAQISLLCAECHEVYNVNSL